MMRFGQFDERRRTVNDAHDSDGRVLAQQLFEAARNTGSTEKIAMATMNAMNAWGCSSGRQDTTSPVARQRQP